MPPQQPPERPQGLPVLPEQPQWQTHPDCVAVTFEGAKGDQQPCCCNPKTRKTQWRPPAPPTEQLPDADEALNEPAPARRTLNDHGVVPGPEGSPTDAVTANTFVADEAVVEVQPAKLPATEVTFVPEKVRRLNDRDGEGTGLSLTCKKHGTRFEDADGPIKRAKIHANVDAHFLELHELEGTVPSSSRCHSFQAQKTDRARKEHRDVVERKARSSRVEAEGVPLKTAASKQRHLTTEEAVTLFGELGCCLDEFDSSLRCRRDDEQVRPKDGAHHRRHFESAKTRLLCVSNKLDAQVRQTVSWRPQTALAGSTSTSWACASRHWTRIPSHGHIGFAQLAWPSVPACR